MDYITLGSIASIKGGKRLPAGVSLSQIENDHPYIRVRDLNNVRMLEKTADIEYVDDETQKSIARYIVDKGDIVISIVGTIGLIAIVGDSLHHANLTENCVRLTEFSKDFDSLFLYYYLISDICQDEIQKRTVGAVQPKLPLKNIAMIPIPKIDLQTQKRIAGILSSLDDKIEGNNQINRNLEEQAKAIFKSWFVDFEPFGGEPPDDWKDGTIADLGKVTGGGTPSKAKEEYYSQNGIPWITPKDLSINKSKFISRGQIDISDAGLSNSSAIVMPKGTVLFSSRAPIGYIAIAKNDITTNQGFKSVVPYSHIGTPFVYMFLKHNLEKIESVASGSTFKEVSGGVMKSIPALIPDNKSLSAFTEQCQPLFQKQEVLEEESNILKETRDTLLPKLMSGEFDINIKKENTR